MNRWDLLRPGVCTPVSPGEVRPTTTSGEDTRSGAVDLPEDPLHPYRTELHRHCYRMLGSLHDAEDVLQEVSVRAWRGRAEFEARSSLRTWLHRITVNACLNELRRKERRVLPVDVGPAADPVGPPDVWAAQPDVPWLDPLPDPADAAAVGEGVELAFVAAVQHLPPNQRAALIMFDVLGFSAEEVADTMATSTASVNSALQRARVRIERHLPEQSQRTALAELGDRRQRELVAHYTSALRDHDVEGMLALLTEDATWSMPPLPMWFRGHADIRRFLEAGPYTQRWRHVPTTANGQLAVGCYLWDAEEHVHRAYALDVLEIRGDRIASVVAFLQHDLFPRFELPTVLP